MSNLINSKVFKYTFLSLILAEILSYLGWKFPVVEIVCFSAIMVLTLALSLKKLEYGLYFIFAELFIGSKGYLFYLTINGEKLISLRMGLFMVVMGVFLANVILRRSVNDDEGSRGIQNRILKKISSIFRGIPRPAMIAGLGMTTILIWAFFWGLLRGNGWSNVFLDFNNWLYFLLILPVMYVVVETRRCLVSTERKNYFFINIISIMAAAVFWLGLKSLFLFYIFSHQSAWALPEIYIWLRDTAVGEVTHVSGNIFRIFIQSQIYSLIFFFIMWLQNSKLQVPSSKQIPNSKFQIPNFNIYYLFLIICLTTIIISFSRSFWLGLIAGLFLYFYLLVFLQRARVLAVIKEFVKIAAVVLVSLGIVFLVLKLPPKVDTNLLKSFNARFGLEAAANSRLNQLGPLLKAMAVHPLIGSGFGATFTYQTEDPRIVPLTLDNSGLYTTYASEWGYLDMILKFGLVGIGVYLFLIFKILKGLINVKDQMSNDKIQNEDYKLQTSFFLAFIALLIVNIFSPYLNHPLGIGFIILSFFVIVILRTPTIRRLAEPSGDEESRGK